MESDDTITELSFLAEILGTKSLPGSLDLVSALLDTLSKLIQRESTSQADVNYVDQMLMSAIDNAASNILVRTFHKMLKRCRRTSSGETKYHTKCYSPGCSC